LDMINQLACDGAETTIITDGKVKRRRCGVSLFNSGF